MRTFEAGDIPILLDIITAAEWQGERQGEMCCPWCKRLLRADRLHDHDCRAAQLMGWARQVAAVLSAFLLAAGLLCGAAPLHAQEPPPAVSIVSAAGVSLSDESAVIPVFLLRFDAPVTVGDSPVCRLAVDVSLSGLPGESIDIQKPQTWKAGEVFGELQRRVGSDNDGGSTYVVGRAGFHTRILPADQTPRQRYARSYGVGVRVERRDAGGSIRRSVALLYGRSDVSSPHFDKGQILIEGHAKVANLAGADIVIGGDAYLSVSRSPSRGARDVLRVWVGAGWGG
jgi:hypothetical protein